MRFLTIKLHLLLLMTIEVGEAHKHTLGGRLVVGDFFHTVSQLFQASGMWFKLARKRLDFSLWFFSFVLCCRRSRGIWATLFGGSWGALYGARSVSLSGGLELWHQPKFSRLPAIDTLFISLFLHKRYIIVCILKKNFHKQDFHVTLRYVLCYGMLCYVVLCYVVYWTMIINYAIV